MLNLLAEKLKISKKGSYTPPSLKEEQKRVIEALLFSSNEPISAEKIAEILKLNFTLKTEEIKHLLKELQEEYRNLKRSFQLDEIGNGYLLRTTKEYAPYVELLYQDKRGERLSKAATEVIAIIAYKEPITKLEIEKIRGVDSSGAIQSLLERELIAVVGRLDVPGKPSQFGLTKKFLTHFGLKSLQDLRERQATTPATSEPINVPTLKNKK